MFISEFRKKYGCQHVLTRILVDIKAALDGKEHTGLSALDLNKAFDCLSHPLLLSKFYHYGVSESACNLILWSYLSERAQRVK